MIFLILKQLTNFWNDLLVHAISPCIVSVSPSFSPFQSAYRKLHSTENALLKLTKWHLGKYRSWQNYYSHSALLYVCSCWYSWPRHIPSQAWTTFGLSGFVISWIQSYLFSRSSFVKIDSSSPVTTELTGVHQSSVLGPLLFVFFILPILNVISLGQAKLQCVLASAVL